VAGDPEGPLRHRVIRTEEVDARERYQLLTSLVVPRPIGWVSTRGTTGVLNVAPFSFFSAVASSPMLVSLSIGRRGGVAKDSLRNILDQGAFCVNVVTEAHLEAMNRTAENLPPEGDEFAFAGLAVAEAETVDAPYVADCPAVLECELHRHVELDEAGELVLGKVTCVRLDPGLPIVEGSAFVDSEGLRPVGRLWGTAYTLLREIRVIPRQEL
jgi:flavin reductase (DIM6/NTAB) family NADH-FMN oxidoreductase RutF